MIYSDSAGRTVVLEQCSFCEHLDPKDCLSCTLALSREVEECPQFLGITPKQKELERIRRIVDVRGKSVG